MLIQGKCCRFIFWLEHFRVQCLKVNRYLATKPEVEAFRDQGFVLPEVESLRIQILWLLKKSFTLEGGARHQFINRE